MLLSHSRQELEPVPSPPPTPGWEGHVRGPGRRRGSSRAACSWAVCREYAWPRRAGGRDGVLVDTDSIWENRTRTSPLESENLPCDPKSQSPQLGSRAWNPARRDRRHAPPTILRLPTLPPSSPPTAVPTDSGRRGGSGWRLCPQPRARRPWSSPLLPAAEQEPWLPLS